MVSGAVPAVAAAVQQQTPVSADLEENEEATGSRVLCGQLQQSWCRGWKTLGEHRW